MRVSGAPRAAQPKSQIFTSWPHVTLWNSIVYGVAFCQQQVVWLDVSVQDVLAMEVL